VCVFKVPLLSWYYGAPVDAPIRSGKSSGDAEASFSCGCLATRFLWMVGRCGVVETRSTSNPTRGSHLGLELWSSGGCLATV
jgi:hypothetical protein